MKVCRFIQFSDGSKYTTANELGPYLESKGIKLGVADDQGSHHYGSYINRKLIAGLKQNPSLYNSAVESMGYGYFDFPKLLENQGNNNTIIELFMKNKLCVSTSVALTRKGGSENAMDLYTQKLVEHLLTCYGHKVDLSEFVVIATCSESPVFTTNKRDRNKPDSRKPLITNK